MNPAYREAAAEQRQVNSGDVEATGPSTFECAALVEAVLSLPAYMRDYEHGRQRCRGCDTTVPMDEPQVHDEGGMRILLPGDDGYDDALAKIPEGVPMPGRDGGPTQ